MSEEGILTFLIAMMVSFALGCMALSAMEREQAWRHTRDCALYGVEINDWAARNGNEEPCEEGERQ